MKKLFAMLLALCMACGVGCAGAETTDAQVDAMSDFLNSYLSSSMTEDEAAREIASEIGEGSVTVGDFKLVIPEGWTGINMSKTYSQAEAENSRQLTLGGYNALGMQPTDEELAEIDAYVMAEIGKPTGYIDIANGEETDYTFLRITFASAVSLETANEIMSATSDENLDMVSSAEYSYYSSKQIGGDYTTLKDEFVTIGWFAGEPIRRVYTGYESTEESMYGSDDARISVKKNRNTAVVWSSEALGVEIVIHQTDIGNAANVDSIVDEIMLSFSYEGEKGSFKAGLENDSSVTLDSPSSFDMGDLDLGGFDMSGFDMDSFDMGGFDSGTIDLGGFDAGSFDMSSFDMSGFDMSSFDMDSFGSFLGQ